MSQSPRICALNLIIAIKSLFVISIALSFTSFTFYKSKYSCFSWLHCSKRSWVNFSQDKLLLGQSGCPAVWQTTDVFPLRETTTENTSGAGDSLVPRPLLFALDGAVEEDSCQWHFWSKTSLFTFEFLWHIFIKDNFFGTNLFVVQPDLWYGSRRAELLKWPLTMIKETTAWLLSI